MQLEIAQIAFMPHLNALGYASRPIKDWVLDSILNPTCDEFNIGISEFIEIMQNVCGSRFELVASSPNLICNLSWYKDFDFSFAEFVRNEFWRKRHLLLEWKSKDSFRLKEQNIALGELLNSFRLNLKEFRFNRDFSIAYKICEILKQIIKEHKDLGDNFCNSIKDVLDFAEEICCYLMKDSISDSIESEIKMAKFFAQKVAQMSNFAHFWGRGAQYISFIRIA